MLPWRQYVAKSASRSIRRRVTSAMKVAERGAAERGDGGERRRRRENAAERECGGERECGAGGCAAERMRRSWNATPQSDPASKASESRRIPERRRRNGARRRLLCDVTARRRWRPWLRGRTCRSRCQPLSRARCRACSTRQRSPRSGSDGLTRPCIHKLSWSYLNANENDCQ
jgi:hypothetical protein